MNDLTNQQRRPDGKFGPAIVPQVSADALDSAAAAANADRVPPLSYRYAEETIMAKHAGDRYQVTVDTDEDGDIEVRVSDDMGSFESVADVADGLGDMRTTIVHDDGSGTTVATSAATGDEAAEIIRELEATNLSDHVQMVIRPDTTGQVDRIADAVHAEWADDRRDFEAYSTLIEDTVQVDFGVVEFEGEPDTGWGEVTVTDVYMDETTGPRLELRSESGTYADVIADHHNGTFRLRAGQAENVETARRNWTDQPAKSSAIPLDSYSDLKQSSARVVPGPSATPTAGIDNARKAAAYMNANTPEGRWRDDVDDALDSGPDVMSVAFVGQTPSDAHTATSRFIQEFGDYNSLAPDRFEIEVRGGDEPGGGSVAVVTVDVDWVAERDDFELPANSATSTSNTVAVYEGYP